jgi:serine/threonine-protein kinase
MADTQNQPERAAAARKLAGALEPKLSHVTVNAPHPVDGLRIRVAGKAIDGISVGKPVPVDPGEIRIEATAPDHQPWTSTVTVGAGGDAEEVVVPRLEPAESGSPSAHVAPGPDPAAPGGASLPDGPDDGASTWSDQHTAALVVGGVGVVGVVLGGVFGGVASSQWNEALSYCNDEDTSDCTDEAGPLSQDATTSATVSTVGFAVGGAAVATGVILWLTAPTPDAPAGDAAWRLTPALGPGIAGTSLHGTF